MGTKITTPRVDTAIQSRGTPTHWLVADWLGVVEPAPPGESIDDPVPGSPSTTPTNRGRKWWSTRSITPLMVWKPQLLVRYRPVEVREAGVPHQLEQEGSASRHNKPTRYCYKKWLYVSYGSLSTAFAWRSPVKKK